MQAPPTRLDEALRLYESGRRGEAEAMCRRLLRGRPRDAGALHLLGVLAHERGDDVEAASALERAVRVDPRDATRQLHLGEVRRALGQHEAAVDCYRRALSLDASLVDAWYGLGNALFELGRPAEAVAAYREGVQLAPADAELHNNLGNALAALGRLDQAYERYRRSASIDSGYADAHANLGWVSGKLGWPGESVASYRRAVELRPESAPVRFQLGNALRDLERFEEAAECYREALERDPGHVEACNNLGDCLDKLGRFAEATAHFERALALEPNVAEIHVNLAMCLQNQGRFEEAVTEYRRASELKPELGSAYWGLASNQSYQVTDRDVAQMRALLADEGLPRESRVHVSFALGRVYDERGDFDRAFACYRTGNALKAEDLAHDPEGFSAYVDRLVNTFTAAFFSERRGFGSDSELPIFVVGMPRSGSTLVEQILSSHPEMHGAGELQDMRLLAGALPQRLGTDAPFPECAARLDAEAAERLAADYLSTLRRHAPEARRVSDKMLGNYLRLGVIALLFPNARVLHCVRDPMDTCLSCYFQNFTSGLQFTYDLRHLGLAYRDYERLMAHWRETLPLPMFEVRYEDLVADLEGTSRALAGFLGLEWDERCLSFHRQERILRTASFWQARQPLYSASVGRWRRYQKHLGPLLEALGVEL